MNGRKNSTNNNRNNNNKHGDSEGDGDNDDDGNNNSTTTTGSSTTQHYYTLKWAGLTGWLCLSLWNTHIRRERERAIGRMSESEREESNTRWWRRPRHTTTTTISNNHSRALCITSKRTSLSHIMCLLNTTDNERMPIASLFLPLAKRSCAWDNFFLQFLGSIFGFFPFRFSRIETERRKENLQNENIADQFNSLRFFLTKGKISCTFIRESSVFLVTIRSNGRSNSFMS